MALVDQQPEIPTWAAVALTAFAVFSFGYGIIIRQSLLEAVLLWLWLGGIAVSLFVVYLFYRFVVAVEKIADKI